MRAGRIVPGTQHGRVGVIDQKHTQINTLQIPCLVKKREKVQTKNYIVNSNVVKSFFLFEMFIYYEVTGKNILYLSAVCGCNGDWMKKRHGMAGLHCHALKLRRTYIDMYSLVHAQKQGVKVEVVNWGLVRPFRIVSFDFQTNPYAFHVPHVRQKCGDEV